MKDGLWLDGEKQKDRETESCMHLAFLFVCILLNALFFTTNTTTTTTNTTRTRYFEDVKVDILTYGGNEDNIQFKRMECELGDCSKVERFYGDQSNTDFLETVANKRPEGWDIIIDDASVSSHVCVFLFSFFRFGHFCSN
jgi:hypothetical protein